MADWILLTDRLPETSELVRLHPRGADPLAWNVGTVRARPDGALEIQLAGNASPQEFDAWKPVEG
jgi:hypothetical protein